MLKLRRTPGQSIQITHTSGDVIVIHIGDIRRFMNLNEVEMSLEDDARNFEIERTERAGKAINRRSE